MTHDIHLGGRLSRIKAKARADAQAKATRPATLSSIQEASRLRQSFEFNYRRVVFAMKGVSEYEPWGKYAGGLAAWLELTEKLRKQGIDDPARFVFEAFCSGAAWQEFMTSYMNNSPPKNADGEARRRKPKKTNELFSPDRLAEPAFIQEQREQMECIERDMPRKRKYQIDELGCKIREKLLVKRYEDEDLEDDDERKGQGKTFFAAECQDGYEALISVLRSKQTSLTPLFKYAMTFQAVRDLPKEQSVTRASRLRHIRSFSKLLDEVRLSAQLQYLSHPAYATQFQGLLPGGFAKEAEAFYELLVANPTG